MDKTFSQEFVYAEDGKPTEAVKPAMGKANMPEQGRRKPIEDKMLRPGRDPYGDMPQHPYSEGVGPRGPVVMEDGVLHETLETFTHEKRIERAVHVKGFGALGYFQTDYDMSAYTKLGFLQKPGTQVPVASRFSLAVSTKGSADTGRNVRGFSTKFYTDDGVFDLLTNHIPVFLVRDAIRFPEAIKAFLPAPTNNLTDPNRFWDFISRCPEATHFLTWLYSDVGTISSLRKIRASSVNTFVWKNARDERRLVKYHWIPEAGEAYIDRQTSVKLAGENPDICGQDLFDTIASGKPVVYTLHVQLMDPQDYRKLPYDPLDATKTWSEDDYPLLPVGRLVLDRNPDNYDEQVESIAFSPANLLEGAEFSNDKLLQGRHNVYWDAQRYRMGPDFRKKPINHQKMWSPDNLVTTGLGENVRGELIRTDTPKPDDFTQAGLRYSGMTAMEKAHLVDNIASQLYSVQEDTRNRVMGYFRNASPEMADKITLQMQVYQA